MERALAAIWGEALGLEKVGVKDDFFELGGDSVLGLQHRGEGERGRAAA